MKIKKYFIIKKTIKNNLIGINFRNYSHFIIKEILENISKTAGDNIKDILYYHGIESIYTRNVFSFGASLDE